VDMGCSFQGSRDDQLDGREIRPVLQWSIVAWQNPMERMCAYVAVEVGHDPRVQSTVG